MRHPGSLLTIARAVGSALLATLVALSAARAQDKPVWPDPPPDPSDPVVPVRCAAYVTNNKDTGVGSLRAAVVNPPSPIFGAICFDAAVFNANAPVANRTITVKVPIVLGKDVWIAGPGGGVVIVSGGGASRVFTVSPGISAALRGMTIRNGNATFGGGVYNDNGLLFLHDMRLESNGANAGGGIYSNKGEVTIKYSSFTSNWASGGGTGNGGAIYGYYSRSIRIVGSSFHSNSAASSGGALEDIQCDDLSIEDSTIDGNWAHLGAGIYASTPGPVTLAGTAVTGNGASGSGGGLYVDDLSTPVLIDDSDLGYNWAIGNGGGIMVNNRTVAPTGTVITLQGTSTVHDNSASSGGGIYADGATLVGAVAGTNVVGNLPDNIVP